MQSLFSNKKITSFEIEPDTLTTGNVLAQTLQQIRDEIAGLRTDIAKLNDIKSWESLGDTKTDEPKKKWTPPPVSQADHERFAKLCEINGTNNAVAGTVQLFTNLLDQNPSTIKNMVNKMEASDEYDVEFIRKVEGGKHFLRITKRK